MSITLNVQTILVVSIAIYIYLNYLNPTLIETLALQKVSRSGMVVSKPSVVEVKPKVRFIRIQFEDGKPHILNINEIQAWVGGVNVALKKSAILGKQFATANDFGASYLVDGVDTSMKNGKRSLAHTTDSVDSFVEVDLLTGYPVDRVTVINRDDCCQDRIVGAFIIIKDELGNVVKKQKINTIRSAYNVFLVGSPPARQCTSLSNVRLPGGGFQIGNATEHISPYPLILPTAEDCKQKCVSNEDCASFVYMPGRECYLHNRAYSNYNATSTKFVGATSGFCS